MLVAKNPPASVGDIRDMGLIPVSGRSPGGGQGNPLQYSHLENPTNRRAWQLTAHEVTKSWTELKQLGMHACDNTHPQLILYNYSHRRQIQLSPVLNCELQEITVVG